MTEKVSDYQQPLYFTPKTDLSFQLSKTATEITATLKVVANESLVLDTLPDIELNGHENTVIKSIEINGVKLNNGVDYYIKPDGNFIKLIIPNKFGRDFELKQVVEVNPEANTSNEGLYISDGAVITQNEAQGFRRIIFSIDRPDNLSVYTTTVEGDKKDFPVLLSNGNELPVAQPEDSTRHRAKFIDPFPKPTYLFALCCGQYFDKKLKYTSNPSGHEKSLQVFAPLTEKPENLNFALDIALKMMRWLEEVYGIELDLEEYKIVGASVFNAGAMENKGLNVFSASDVFLDPSFSTDANYRRVLTVIAHEIAHNWAGNRVTVRDWSQLSLKEGLATHTEQQFHRAMLGREATRIADVLTMRNSQFPQDASKLAHPVHPKEYESITNFYTNTIYEKGSELLQTLEELLGKDVFIEAIKQYFKDFDGNQPSTTGHFSTGVTIEQFIASISKTTGRDLSQFLHWYDYAGTPELTTTEHYDEQTKTYSLTITQFCPPTPKQEQEKPPFLIPIRVGLLDANGQELDLNLLGEEARTGEKNKVLELSQRQQTFTFTNIDAKPTPSILRGFTAPVKIKSGMLSHQQYERLIKYDTDAFVRWDSMQTLMLQEITTQLKRAKNGETVIITTEFAKLYSTLVNDDSLPQDFKANILTIPSYSSLLNIADDVNPAQLYEVLSEVQNQLALQNEAKLNQIVTSSLANPMIDELFSLEKPAIAKQRDIFLYALAMLCSTKQTNYLELAQKLAREKTNFTNVYNSYIAYFSSQAQDFTIVNNPINQTLYEKFKTNINLLEKWLGLQAIINSKDILHHMENLVLGKTPGFDISHPHQCYRLLRTFMNSNPAFHDPSGRGYRLMADCILKIDTEVKNYNIAAGLASAFAPSDNMSETNKTFAYIELYRLSQYTQISTELREIINKALAGTEFDPNPDRRIARPCLTAFKPFDIQDKGADEEVNKEDQHQVRLANI